jgi:hypothetical protein
VSRNPETHKYSPTAFSSITPCNYSPTALSLHLPPQLQFDTSLRMLAQAKQAKELAEKRAITLTREIEKQEESLQKRLQRKLTSCVRDRSSLINAENTIQLRYDSNLNAIELRLFLNIVCYANLKLVTELSHCTIESIATMTMANATTCFGYGHYPPTYLSLKR